MLVSDFARRLDTPFGDRCVRPVLDLDVALAADVGHGYLADPMVLAALLINDQVLT